VAIETKTVEECILFDLAGSLLWLVVIVVRLMNFIDCKYKIRTASRKWKPFTA